MSFRKLSIFHVLMLILASTGNASAQNSPSQQQSPANSAPNNLPPWRGSVASLQASIVTGQGFANKAPEGFTNVYSVATGGFGTFAIAAPKGWLPWTAGTPPVAIVEAFRKVDPAWAKAHEPFFSGRDPRQRALLLSGNPNEPVVIKVSFIGRADAKTFEAWRADYRTVFNKDYWDSVSKAEWIDHGSEKAVKAMSYSPDKAYLEIGYHISETKIIRCGTSHAPAERRSCKTMSAFAIKSRPPSPPVPISRTDLPARHRERRNPRDEAIHPQTLCSTVDCFVALPRAKTECGARFRHPLSRRGTA